MFILGVFVLYKGIVFNSFKVLFIFGKLLLVKWVVLIKYFLVLNMSMLVFFVLIIE